MKVTIEVDRGDITECKWDALVRDGRIASIGLENGVNLPLKEGVIRCECIPKVEDMRVTERTGRSYSEWHEPIGVGGIEIVLKADDRFVTSQGYW
jgi:hypothetical protein